MSNSDDLVMAIIFCLPLTKLIMDVPFFSFYCTIIIHCQRKAGEINDLLNLLKIKTAQIGAVLTELKEDYFLGGLRARS